MVTGHPVCVLKSRTLLLRFSGHLACFSIKVPFVVKYGAVLLAWDAR